MYFQSQRQTKDIPKLSFAVTIESHEIDVAGAEFVKGSDTLDISSAIVGNSLGDTLSNKDIWAEFGRERIIPTTIFCRLLCPKLMTKHSIEIQATLQRLKFSTIIKVYRPRNIILF